MNSNPYESCPDRQQLSQLADGDLPAPVEARLVEHLDHCPRCRQVLDSQHDSDPFVRDVHGRLGRQREDTPRLRETLNQLQTATLAQTATDGRLPYADVLPWLETPLEDEIARVGEYHLLEYLGRGGMGVVFKARDATLQRTVAVKFLAPALAMDEAARERFLREARAAASLNHPHVVTVFAVSDTVDLPFLVMEYMPAGSLSQRINQCRRLPIDQAVQFGRQIAAGLAAAHTRDVIHRDVKPDNILLETPGGPAKIADFGLARVAGDGAITRSGFLVGTPAYLAPEAVNETGPLDHRADLYSLGSVLYAMCTGQPPFAGETVMSTLQQIGAAQAPPIERMNPDVPPWLVQVVRRLHAKDPAQRFQSASEVERNLRTRARPTRLPIRWTKSWPYATIGLAAALLLTVLLGYYFRSSPSRLDKLVVRAEDDLEAILANAESGAVIEIRDNGPFRLPAIELGTRSLTVVAAQGTRPVLQFRPEDESEERILFETTGDLTLEGLVLQYIAPDEESEAESLLIACHDGTLRVNRCRLLTEPAGTCLGLEGASEVEVRNCELHAGLGNVVAWEPAPPGRIVFDNCIMTGSIAVVTYSPHKAVLCLSQNTILAEYVLSFDNDEPGFDSSLRVEAEGNTFDTEGHLLFIAELDDDTPIRLPRWIDWHGQHNIFTGGFVAYGNEEDPEDVGWDDELQQWRQQVNEVDSAVWEVQYALEPGQLWDLLEQPTRLKPEFFRISTEELPPLTHREQIPGANPEAMGP